MFSTRLMSNSGLLWPSRIMRTVSTINSTLATDFPADSKYFILGKLEFDEQEYEKDEISTEKQLKIYFKLFKLIH